MRREIRVLCAIAVSLLPACSTGANEPAVPGTYLLDEYRRACELWRIPAAPPKFRESVRVAVPALLMAGRRDPVTPPRTAQDVARPLPRSRVVIWKYGGHGTQGLPTTTCHAAIARQFITTADPVGLDVSCVATARPEPFRGR